MINTISDVNKKYIVKTDFNSSKNFDKMTMIVFMNSFDEKYIKLINTFSKIIIVSENKDILKRCKIQNVNKITKKVLSELRNENIVFSVCIPTLYNYEKGLLDYLYEVLKSLLIVKKYYNQFNINIGYKEDKDRVAGFILNYNKDDEKTNENIKDSINIILENNSKKKFEYIYDRACDIMDEVFTKKNYCDFQNDMCIRQRDVTARKSAHNTMGCCYMVGYTKLLKDPIDLGLCKFMGESGCNIKCLSCKLFTCRYLKKRSVKFNPNDIFILKSFLNNKQKKYLKENYFTERNDMIKKLLELDKN